MITATILTLHLAVLIGLYEFSAGLAGLTGRISWAAMLDEFERSPALTFVTGFMAFAIGGTLVLVHCIWTDLLAVIVSLIGWIALAEGLLLMIVPGPLLAFSRRLVGNQKLVSLIAAAFGLILIALGLTGRVA
ncbi:MAG: DUF2065 domain-containing protein [Sphingomicrobium sp.]